MNYQHIMYWGLSKMENSWGYNCSRIEFAAVFFNDLSLDSINNTTIVMLIVSKVDFKSWKKFVFEMMAKLILT